MEACFLTSNSFSRTIELLPSIKARNLTYPKRKANQFQCRKAPFPSSITCRSFLTLCMDFSHCCHLGSSSSSEDADKPSISADWRSFRARLVAGEQASRLEEPSSLVDPDSAVDHPLPITIGDKWVHTIHEPEKGCLLIATEKLDGVHIFERTTFPHVNKGNKINSSGCCRHLLGYATVLWRTHRGGLFLVNSPKGDDDGVVKTGLFEEVMKGLYYGTKESVGCAAEMVKRNAVAVEDFRFFDGYCGWEKEQLRDEIRAGYWTVAACSPSVIGLTSVGSVGLWEEIIGLMGPRKGTQGEKSDKSSEMYL
ncbi:hypothetical protein CK203_037313 [Vitis vinifera]|uniref:Uncharacterized protein n=1 Tax=Vitis vinifera TaxID=29760 RepID=A0A438H8Q7_VITVI|nr:hypothetical protein CK203_037313 [Vitis vinifera]